MKAILTGQELTVLRPVCVGSFRHAVRVRVLVLVSELSLPGNLLHMDHSGVMNS